MSESDRAASPPSFEAFVRRYQDLVYATAVRLVGREGEAEDIAQTVFMKAFERFAEIGESPAAPGWLKTVTTNACLNHLSRYRRRWRLFTEMTSRTGEEDDMPFETTIETTRSLAADLERADDHRRLTAALSQLPPHQRVPLVLFHFDQMSYQDIAARLGVTLPKIKTDIHRGREVLARLLG
jgi:RNA polymerase sigma-70 factor, ECF subfamily